MRKQEDAVRVVESTFKHFGRIDILVNAAAGNFLVSAEDLSPNGFRTGSASITSFFRQKLIEIVKELKIKKLITECMISYASHFMLMWLSVFGVAL